MADRVYYLVAAGSEVLRVVEAAEQRHKVFQQAMAALKKEFHAKTIWTWNDARFSGMEFKGELPQGWRLDKRKGYAVPRRSVLAGRELASRFAELPTGVDAMVFSGMLSDALGGEYTHYEHCHVAWTTFERHGQQHILSVPAGCKVTPPGCTELKMSEYWAIREAHEKAAS